jgi:hypothetical protein
MSNNSELHDGQDIHSQNTRNRLCIYNKVELRKRSKGWDGMVLAPTHATHADETITCCLEAYQTEDAMWLRKKIQ